MLEDQIKQLESDALGRIQNAKNPDELETVRVDVLGRKGSLAQINIGKLSRRSAAPPARLSMPRDKRSKLPSKPGSRRSPQERSISGSKPNGWISLCRRPVHAPAACIRSP